MLKSEDDTIKAIKYLIENNCKNISCEICPLDIKIPNQFDLCSAIVDMNIKIIGKGTK